MSKPLYIADAFTGTPFRGNPAAICLLEKEAPADWMQSVAAEMNLSETAFLVPTGEGAFGLRWFTPRVEVDLCGHATLGAAHVLYETERLAADKPALFDKRSGRLTCTRTAESAIRMDFPVDPIRSVVMPEGLEEMIDAKPVYAGRGKTDLLVEVATSPEGLAALRPHLARVAELPYRLLILTCEGGGEPYDFVSRCFGPAVGVPEDPVTGSAHTTLAAYWAKRLDKNKFQARQASARGGELGVELAEDRVFLEGEAVIVVEGQLVG